MRRLALTFLALLALLGATVGVSFLGLGPVSLPVNLAIAAAKALLIALVFMHLETSSALLRLGAAAGVVWLALLFLLGGADYLTRPPESPAPVEVRAGPSRGE